MKLMLFNCPGCNSYISKTECNLSRRTEENTCGDKESGIYDHISNSSYHGYIENTFRFNNDSFDKVNLSNQSKVTPK